MVSGDEFAEPGEEAAMYGGPIDAREAHTDCVQGLCFQTRPPDREARGSK